MEFSHEEKVLLFKIARASIEEKLFKKKYDVKVDVKKHPNFNLKCGVFVTLAIAKQLRGCIGYITASTPLFKTIKDAAVSAAYNDPRFYPLTETEYEQVDL
jgi:uncharacterized protein (TIGR00296 family)